MRNMKLIKTCMCILFTLLAMSSRGRAQDFRANLTGQVTDPSGATIKQAEISVVNVDSGTSYTAHTTDKGVYSIPYVLPGNYKVSVAAKGFKTAIQEKVVLLASQTFNQNFKLSVGTVGEQVVVTTTPAQLETSNGSGGTVIDARQLSNVPLNGGQAYSLIGTTAGSQVTSQAGPGGNSGTRGWDVSNSYTIGGGIVGNNQFTLNGTNITSQTTYGNHGAGEWTVSPNIDSIQEVNVMTTTYDARFGRTSGGTVNVVTKSGGDKFHGDARYAYEGALMSANTFTNNADGVPLQNQTQNQFWITGGGPVIKNKVFFFFAFEGYRQAKGGTLLTNVPPAFLRPGYNGNTGVDFSLVQKMDSAEFPTGLPIYQPGTAYCLDPNTAVTACNSNHVAQVEFPGDQIPGTQINATANAFLKYVPLPNIAGAANLVKGNNFVGQTPDLYDYNQPQIRVDYNLTDRTKFYSYFLYWKGTEYRSNNGLNGIGANGNINWIHQNWVATQDVTHVFSPSLIGDFKVSFDRFLESSPDGDLTQQTDPSTLGLAMPLPGTTSSKLLPEITTVDSWGTGVLGGQTVFGNESNLDVTNNFTLDADLTKTAGAHTLEIGGEIDEFQYGNPGSLGSANGNFGFGSGYTQYNPHNQNCYPQALGTGSDAGDTNTCSSNAPNGSSLASLYLGDPSSTSNNHGAGNIDWNKTIFEGQPVYATYFQDNWRVNHRLTLNLGIRYDIQRGLRERNNNLNRGLCLTCVNPVTNNATYQANVQNGSNIGAWMAAGIDPSSLAQVLGGIQFAGTDGQSRDAYDTDYSNVGPRFGFAFAVDPKTVIRGGYGIMYSFGLEGGSSIGETQSTNYTASTDGGNTPTNYFRTGAPFSSGLNAPTGSSLGLETDLGNGGVQVDFPNRKIPMEQIVSMGVQRELPWGLVLDARFAGNFTSRLRTFLWVNGTASLSEIKAVIANPQIYNQQVPNPYYGVAGLSGPGQCGTGTTVSAVALLLPLSQYCSPGGNGLVGEYNSAQGRNWYDGLEVKVEKRVYGRGGKGLSFQTAYTYSKTINGDGYQNGWPYQDPTQQHWLATTDRTHVLSATGVWDLPVGKGGMFYSNPGPILGLLVNGWNTSAVFNAQSGTPIQVNTGYSYVCPGTSYKPKGGTSVGQGRWFSGDTNCWQGLPAYGLGYLSGTTAQVRNPTIPTLDASVQKNTPIHGDNWLFTLRLDAFNAMNNVLFNGPDTNPGSGPASYTSGSGWSGFGTVGNSQANFPRILQVTGKISF